MHVTTIGLDIAQHWFQLHGSTPRARSSSDENYAASEVVEFFRNLEPCLVRAHFRDQRPRCGQDTRREAVIRRSHHVA